MAWVPAGSPREVLRHQLRCHPRLPASGEMRVWRPVGCSPLLQPKAVGEMVSVSSRPLEVWVLLHRLPVVGALLPGPPMDWAEAVVGELRRLLNPADWAVATWGPGPVSVDPRWGEGLVRVGRPLRPVAGGRLRPRPVRPLLPEAAAAGWATAEEAAAVLRVPRLMRLLLERAARAGLAVGARPRLRLLLWDLLRPRR